MQYDDIENIPDLLNKTNFQEQEPTQTETNQHIVQMREMYPMYEDKDDTTLALAFRKKHYAKLSDDEFLGKINLNQTPLVVDTKPLVSVSKDDVTTRESFFDGVDEEGAKYITPKDQDEKIDKENREMFFGNGEDFESKEWNFSDEVIEPFKRSAKEVAENNIMAEAVLVLGDKANDPKELAKFLAFKDEIDKLSPTHYAQKELANLDTSSEQPKHSVDTFLDAYEKKGVLSLDTWSEFLKAIPSVTAGSVPNTVQAVVNLPQATVAYTYKLAKDSLEADGINSEPTRTDMAKSAPVATLVMTLDKFGFSKASAPLKAEIAKAIVKNPATKIKDIMKSFAFTTVHGVKYELPTEITQEIAEVVYVKDKDTTGEDILKASIGAVMGTAGMTTGISAVKEVVSATKPNSTEKILADEINKAVDGTEINRDVLNQNVVNSLNPNQAQYRVQSENKTDISTIDKIGQDFENDIKESLHVEPKDELDKIDEGYKELETELFGEETLEQPKADDSVETEPVVEKISPVKKESIEKARLKGIEDANSNVAPREVDSIAFSIKKNMGEAEEKAYRQAHKEIADKKLEDYINKKKAIKETVPVETFDSESVARLKELEEKSEDELTTDEKWELEDLQEAELDETIEDDIISDDKKTTNENKKDIQEEQTREDSDFTKEEDSGKGITTNEEVKEESETSKAFKSELESLERVTQAWKDNPSQDESRLAGEKQVAEDVEYFKNSGIVEAIESPEYVMFKEKGNKRATRGVLIDLPFGLKGVIVYDKKGGGKIWEYTTSSYGGSFTDIYQLPNVLLNARRKFLNVGEEQLLKAFNGMEHTNPKIVKAKKIKDGTESYNTEVKITQTDGTVKKEKGEAWVTKDGIELVIHKNKKNKWVATEVNTGLKLPTENTLGDSSRTKLKEGIEKQIKKVGLKKLKKIISDNVERVTKEKAKEEAMSEVEKVYDSMSEDAKRELLAHTGLMDVAIDVTATIEKWENLSDSQKGVFAEAYIKSKSKDIQVTYDVQGATVVLDGETYKTWNRHNNEVQRKSKEFGTWVKEGVTKEITKRVQEIVANDNKTGKDVFVFHKGINYKVFSDGSVAKVEKYGKLKAFGQTKEIDDILREKASYSGDVPTYGKLTGRMNGFHHADYEETLEAYYHLKERVEKGEIPNNEYSSKNLKDRETNLKEYEDKNNIERVKHASDTTNTASLDKQENQRAEEKSDQGTDTSASERGNDGVRGADGSREKHSSGIPNSNINSGETYTEEDKQNGGATNRVEPRADERRDTELSDNGSDSVGGGLSDRVSKDGQGENSSPVSKSDSQSDVGNDADTSKTRSSTKRGERDSDSPVHSGDVKESPFVQNIDDTFARGEVGRYYANIEAIKLLKENKTHYTAEDKQTLSKYTGWGGLQKAFRDAKGEFKDGWAERGRDLQQIVSPQEYNDIKAGILDAYYTPIPLVQSMWQISQQLGFKGGTVLEPSMGTGRFIGLTPANLKSNTAFNGVEIDSTTYKIATILYGNINGRNKGFETTNYKSNHDLVIGNPPYGSFKLHDKNNKKYNSLTAHNYFVVKSLDALNEGGVLNFIISSSFLDNLDKKTIELVNSKAKMIGAIRLPSDAFSEAGTKVTTDIILFQKLKDGEKGNSTVWAEKSKLNGLKINKYFVDNKDMLLGEWKKGFRGAGTLSSTEHFETDLQNAISKLPSNIMNYNAETTQKEVDNADSLVPPSVMYIKDEKVYVNVKDGEGVKPELINISKDKAQSYIEIRDNLTTLIRMQMDSSFKDIQIETQRELLNSSYDSFVKEFGALNSTAKRNKSFITKDKNGFLVTTLEEGYQSEIKKNNKKGEEPRSESYKKADILTKRTASPVKEITTESSSEALAFSLNHKGVVDLAFMSKISSKNKETLLKELKGQVYYDVDMGYVTADIFLSGDVKTKLANAVDEEHRKALEKVIPKDLEAKDIKPEFGQRWIGEKNVELFMQEELGFRNITVKQSRASGKWFVEGYSYGFPFEADKVKNNTLVEKALNSQQIKISYKAVDGKTYVDTQATELANAKVDELKEAFENWVYKDKDRRNLLVKKFNELNNRFVEINSEDVIKNYHIPNIKFFKPRAHQKKAVHKATFGNSPLLLNHTVGSGKTLTSQMIVMEWRRLGKAKKPMIVTLKSVVPQYVKEFKEAYPSAKILAPDTKDFDKDNRVRLLSSIATGDYDAIIISHEQLQKIENPSELQKQIIEDEIVALEVSLVEANQNGESKRTARDLENAIKKLKTKFETLEESIKDNILSFDQLGIDGLVIDESHIFKKLAYSTVLGSIKGMPDTGGSKRAFDLYVKTQHIQKTNRNKNIVFMTGTPITNTIPELYLVQKYLQGDTLHEQGVENFDAWAKNYIEQTTEVEITATGTFKEVTRIKNFKNMPTLIQTTSQFIDTATNEDIKKSDPNFKLPPLKDGKATLVLIEPSSDQIAYNESLIQRVESLTKDSDDNHLVIFGDAGKMSIDMRLISDEYEDTKTSKINEVVSRVMSKYKEFDSVQGTQLVFSDKGVPKGGGKAKAQLEKLINLADKGDEKASKLIEENYSSTEIEDILYGGEFSVYDDIKAKLVKQGIPESEVVFIHDFETPAKKRELGELVNAGKIRVVIGSTQKLGTGINVQKKLTAVHHIDIPYTPAELEQRNGRIIRQGNTLLESLQNFEVEIVYYATKRTLDGMKWQILENKSKFIKQFFDGVSDSDLEIEEMSNSELAEKMKAEASGNPLLLEKIQADKKIKKLKTLKRSHELGKIQSDEKILELTGFLGSVDLEISMYNEDIKQVKSSDIKINGKKLGKSKDVGDALVSEINKYKKAKGIYAKTIGSIGDIEIAVSYDYPMERATISIIGETTMDIEYDFTKPSGVGLGVVFNNKLKSLESKVGRLVKEKPIAVADKKRLEESQKGKFEKQSELDSLVIEQQRIVREINESAKEIKPESSNSYMKAEPKPYTRESEANDAYVLKEGFDNAGVNYVPTYAVNGMPVRPVSGLITLGDKEVSLPTLEKPMNADSLRVYLSDIIGNRLYEGRLKNKSVLGVYKRDDSSIRVQSYSDVEVMAHEMAHYLDFFHKNKSKNAKGSFFRAEILKNKDELKSISYTSKKDEAIKEGFAEFVRLWLTNYDTVVQVAPSMVKDFEAKLKRDKALHVKMVQLQEGMHSYFFQGEHAMLRSKRGGELNSIAKKIQRSQKEIGKKLRQKAIDKLHTIKRIEAEIKGDVSSDPLDSSYKALQMVNGHSSIMYGAMNIGVPTILENGDISHSGKSLNDIFAPATKVSEERVRLLEDYLVAKRADELMGQGRENLISKEEIEIGLKLVETYPEFETIFSEYQEFNDAMLEFYVSMKLITSDQKENFQEFNKNYVPFHRITESVQHGEVPPSKIGQRLTGGTHSLGSIMDNIINGIESNIKEALISRGKSMFYEMIESSDSGGVWAIRVSTDSKMVTADAN